jgi:hypothetical protein
MKAVTSALAGGIITPGEAATIAAELAMPDLDQIKQGEQDRRGRFASGRSGNPAGRPRGWWSTPLSGRSTPATSSICSWSRPTASTTRAEAAGMNGWALQPIGEIVLRIRSAWQDVQSSIQFMIAVGRPAQSHQEISRHCEEPQATK